jgi:hypothetical protein
MRLGEVGTDREIVRERHDENRSDILKRAESKTTSMILPGVSLQIFGDSLEIDLRDSPMEVKADGSYQPHLIAEFVNFINSRLLRIPMM